MAYAGPISEGSVQEVLRTGKHLHGINPFPFMPGMSGILLPTSCSIATKTIVEGSSSLTLCSSTIMPYSAPLHDLSLIFYMLDSLEIPSSNRQKILIHFKVHVCPPPGHSSEIEPQEHKVCTKEFASSAFLVSVSGSLWSYPLW